MSGRYQDVPKKVSGILMEVARNMSERCTEVGTGQIGTRQFGTGQVEQVKSGQVELGRVK